MLSPHFIPQSVIHTQSAVCSPYFILTGNLGFYDACSVGIRDDMLLLPKRRQLLHGLNRMAFGKQLLSIFTSATKKQRTCWCTNPVRVELFFQVKTFVGFVLHILRTELWASEGKSTHFKNCVGFGRREEGTQHAAKLQLSVHTESRTHFVEACLQRS